MRAPAVSELQPFRPVDYVMTLPDRSNRVLFYGVAGALFVGASLLIAVAVLVTTPWLSTQIVYSWPTDLLGLGLSIPAWMMGRADLRAIRAGAMDVAGTQRTRVGFWCGCLGTILGAIPFLLAVTAIAFATFA